ncbi:MAG: hypothetical protein KDA25_10450 [Phycisphaerales bacterium]|nr:hypothetical protein [Phycisphaerales bacterium]
MRIAVCALYVIMLTVVARPGQAQRFDGAYQAADVVLRESDFLTLIDGLDLDPLTTRPAAMAWYAEYAAAIRATDAAIAAVHDEYRKAVGSTPVRIVQPAEWERDEHGTPIDPHVVTEDEWQRRAALRHERDRARAGLYREVDAHLQVFHDRLAGLPGWDEARYLSILRRSLREGLMLAHDTTLPGADFPGGMTVHLGDFYMFLDLMPLLDRFRRDDPTLRAAMATASDDARAALAAGLDDAALVYERDVDTQLRRGLQSLRQAPQEAKPVGPAHGPNRSTRRSYDVNTEFADTVAAVVSDAAGASAADAWRRAYRVQLAPELYEADWVDDLATRLDALEIDAATRERVRTVLDDHARRQEHRRTLAFRAGVRHTVDKRRDESDDLRRERFGAAVIDLHAGAAETIMAVFAALGEDGAAAAASASLRADLAATMRRRGERALGPIGDDSGDDINEALAAVHRPLREWLAERERDAATGRDDHPSPHARAPRAMSQRELLSEMAALLDGAAILHVGSGTPDG